MTYQLKTRQVCLFFIAFLPATKFFMLPSILAKSADEAMWISALILFVADFLTLLALTFACRKAETDFYGLLEMNFGKVGSKIILGAYLLFFLLKSIIPINEQKDYVILTLYETMPNSFNFLPIFLVSFYFCVKSKRVIGRCADLLWIATTIGLTILFVFSVSSTDFGSMLPFFAKSAGQIFKGAYLGSSWYGDAVYLMFFLGDFAFKKKDTIKILGAFALASLAVIFFMIVFYGIFTSIAFRQLFALTEISKYTSVINNMGRFDYIGIINILFTGIFSLALPLYFATEILTKIFPFKTKWAPALIVNLGMLLFNVFFNEFFASIEYFILNFASAYFILLGNVLPIFTLLLRKKEKNYALYTN